MAKSWTIHWQISGTVVIEEDEECETPEQATAAFKNIDLLELFEMVEGKKPTITNIIPETEVDSEQ